MKNYDLIVIGTGSAMNIVEPYLEKYSDSRIAVIDKDEPGGICLTRGCIPSKLILYPAELVRTIRESTGLGIEAHVESVHFSAIMERMRLIVSMDIMQIEEALKNNDNIYYYRGEARFVEPHVLSVAGETITSSTILLVTGSKPLIPEIEGLEEAGYHNSDTFLNLKELAPDWAVIGGGYIAAEYGFFLETMGAGVSIIGRNPQFLKQEEPEVSALALHEARKYMHVSTGEEVVKIEKTADARKKLTIEDSSTGERRELTVSEILVAAGRSSTHDILEPEKGEVETDEEGWISTDSHLETSSPGVWAFGDATGRYLFKHIANYESEIVYANAVLEQKPKLEPDYHAVPHAVFMQPEIAAVGMKEREAVETFGKEDIRIGFSLFEETAKGMAMDLQDSGYFVKTILRRSDGSILGGHIIGPQASVLLHEIIVAMNTDTRRYPASTIHIHPALSEVVAKAFGEPMSVDEYHHLLSHLFGGGEDEHDHESGGEDEAHRDSSTY